MLADSAHLQESDCQYVNRKERRTDGTCRQPLYTADDVRAIVRRFVGVRYGDVVTPIKGMTAKRRHQTMIRWERGVSIGFMNAASW